MGIELSPGATSKGDPPSSPPELAKYSDYRLFLGDYYLYKKNHGRGFSFRAFATQSGYRSPNYLQLIIQGKRSLTEQSAQRVAKALGFSPSQRAHFVALVRWQESATPADRAIAHKTLLASSKRLVSKEISRAQSEVLSHWYHLPVRELVFLPDFKPKGEWIAQKLRSLITPEQAENSLLTLLAGGFLTRSPATGAIEAVDPSLDTGDDFDSLKILNAHRETLLTWRDLMLRVPHEKRELGLLNIPVSRQRVAELKRRIRQFQDEIIGWALEEENPELIVQLGTYMLPLTD